MWRLLELHRDVEGGDGEAVVGVLADVVLGAEQSEDTLEEGHSHLFGVAPLQ